MFLKLKLFFKDGGQAERAVGPFLSRDIALAWQVSLELAVFSRGGSDLRQVVVEPMSDIYLPQNPLAPKEPPATLAEIVEGYRSECENWASVLVSGPSFGIVATLDQHLN